MTATGNPAPALAPSLVARYWRRLGLLGPEAAVLDLGCGVGRMAELRPQRSVKVVGVDFDATNVAAASVHCSEVYELDLDQQSLPFGDHSFDAVIAKDIIEHVLRPRSLMTDVHRVLRPGGRVALSVPMEYGRVIWGDYTHYRGFTERALKQLLEDSGFEPVDVVPMGGVPLAGRLGFVDHIPHILRLPGMRRVFGSSWEASALRL